MGSPERKLMVDLEGNEAQGRRKAHKHGNSLGSSRSCPDLTANGFQIDCGTPLEEDNQAQRAWELLKSPDHLSIHYGGPEFGACGEERARRTRRGWGGWAKSSWPRGQAHFDHLSCSDKLVSAGEGAANTPARADFLSLGISSPSPTDHYRQAWPSGTDPGTSVPVVELDIGAESAVYSNEIRAEAWSDPSLRSDTSEARILLVTGCLLWMPVLCLGPLLPSIYPILVGIEWPPRDNWIKLSSSEDVAAVPSHPSNLVSPSMLLSCLFFSAAVFSSLFCGRRHCQGFLLMGTLALHPFIGLHYNNAGARASVLILNYLILGGLALAMIETGQLTWLMDLQSPKVRRGRERGRRPRKTLVMQHYLISRQGLGHILCGLVITLTLWASSTVHGNAANSQGRLLGPFPEQIPSIRDALPTNRSIHPASTGTIGHFARKRVLSTPSFKTHRLWSTFVSLGCGWNTLLGCCLIASGCATVLSVLGAICSRTIESHSEGHRQFTQGMKKKWEKESVGNFSFYPVLRGVFNASTQALCGNPLWNMIRHLGLLQGFFYLNFLKPTILVSLDQYHLGPILMVYGTSQTLVLWMLGHLAESSIPWRFPLMGVNTLFHIGLVWLTSSLRFQSGFNDFLKFYALSFVWGFVSASWDFITLTHFHRRYFHHSSKEEELDRIASISNLITNKFFGLTVISLYDVYFNSNTHYGIRNEVLIIYLVGLLIAVISYICTEIKQQETQHPVVKYAKTSDDIIQPLSPDSRSNQQNKITHHHL